VIFSFYDLGKFIYFMLVNQSSLTTTQCSEYPFCTSRDSSQTHNTPDSTFSAELWANAAFFLFSILIAVVLYRSVRKNKNYDAAKREQYMAIQQNIGNDSDSDDGRPLPVRQQQQEALVVDTRSTRRRATAAAATPTKNIGHEIPRILVPTDTDEFY
jgi:cbb3-type cytochrome oxidase subunit 3